MLASMRALVLVVALFPVIARAQATSTGGPTTTSGTTGATSGGTALPPTTGTTGATTGDSTGTGEPTGAPPPEYTPCGCRSDAALGGSLLAVGLLALGRRRRR